MYQSLQSSQLMIRISMAIVFFWFGINKFIQPQFWVDAWMPQWVQHAAQAVGMSVANAVILLGILEVLIALSLVTGFFTRGFSAAGLVYLAAIVVFSGLSDIIIRDIGLIGALAALVVWPERRYT